MTDEETFPFVPYDLSRRKEWFVRLLGWSFPKILHAYYKITYEHPERLQSVADKGCVLLPNHQTDMDTPFVRVLLKEHLNRAPYYIMLNTRSKLFEYAGGIPIPQGYYVQRDHRDRKDRRAALDCAKVQRAYAEDAMFRVLSADEILLLYIQGGRYHREPFTVRKPATVQRLLKVQKRLGRRVPFVPVSLEYEALHHPFSKVRVSVGNPIEVADDDVRPLIEHLEKEIVITNAREVVRPPPSLLAD